MQVSRKNIFLLALVLLTFFLSPQAWATEVIESFASHIQVETDSAVVVTETITVVAEGIQIKRGIFRDFPTTYQGADGSKQAVGFTVRWVRRDGIPEPYKLEKKENGVRVKIGDPDVLLPLGRHVYTIRYRSTRQLGFFEGYDELYWNVTGNGWAFPIQEAQAHVTLPDGASVLRHAAYTGSPGEQGKDFSRIATDQSIAFASTRPLSPGEGITIAVAWPKGFVSPPLPPSPPNPLLVFLRKRGGPPVAGAGLVLLAFWYLQSWRKKGRDPEKGPIIPLFAPPDAISPTAARYLLRMGHDDTGFSAAVVNIAVKGGLVIDKSGQHFRLTQTPIRPTELSAGESDLLDALFAADSSVELVNTNHATIGRAMEALRRKIKAEFGNSYFTTNTGYVVAGVCLTVSTAAASLALNPVPAVALPLGAMMLAWCAALAGVCLKLGSRLRELGRVFTFRRLLQALVLGIVLAGFAASLVALRELAWVLPRLWPTLVPLFAMIGVNFLFYRLMKAPTASGRQLLDKIEGFRMFLSVAERERFAQLVPPDVTPVLYERYLPYALALNVEHPWSEKFAAQMEQAKEMQSDDWQPSWYIGHGRNTNHPGSFASDIGAGLGASISAASTAPGSSSGSGGGGSSGGGGGGGGGGGW